MNFLQRLAAATASFATAALVFAGNAHAQAPRPWQMWSQTPGSPVAEQIETLHVLVMVIITVITIFVAGLLGWVCYRYSEKKNPNPSQTSHNTLLEVAWTVIPVLILVVIAIPSFRLVYFQDRTEAADAQIQTRKTVTSPATVPGRLNGTSAPMTLGQMAVQLMPEG